MSQTVTNLRSRGMKTRLKTLLTVVVGMCGLAVLGLLTTERGGTVQRGDVASYGDATIEVMDSGFSSTKKRGEWRCYHWPDQGSPWVTISVRCAVDAKAPCRLSFGWRVEHQKGNNWGRLYPGNSPDHEPGEVSLEPGEEGKVTFAATRKEGCWETKGNPAVMLELRVEHLDDELSTERMRFALQSSGEG
jgi:hypothetical protein